jgi:hypothetical protein
MNTLLSEQTFKGKEQELSDFAKKVANRKSIGESVFQSAFSPTNEHTSEHEIELTKRHRQSDSGDAASDVPYVEFPRQTVHERNAHTAATKQRYQKKQ